jgi:hypothetical protein
MVVGIMRDMEKYRKPADETWWTKFSLIAQNAITATMSHSVLTGFTDFTNNIFDPTNPEKAQTYMKRFTAGMISNIIPNMLKDVIRLYNDETFDANTWSEIFERQSKVAVYTDDLKPKLNILGEEIHADPLFWAKNQEGNRVWNLIVRNSAYISVPSKNTPIYDPARGRDRGLTPDEYYDYVKDSGAMIKSAIEKHIDQLESMGSEEVRDMVDKIERTARDEAKKRLAKLTTDKEMKDNFDEEVIKIRLNKVFEDAGMKDKGGRKYSYHLSNKEKESGNIDPVRVITSLNERYNTLIKQLNKGDISDDFYKSQIEAVEKAKEEWQKQ